MPTKDQITEQAKQVFAQFDTDHDGWLDKDETREFYKVAVTQAGATFSEDNFQAAHGKMDTNGDGKISLEELTAWLLEKAAAQGKLE